MKILRAFFALLLLASPAAAQWQTPNHSVPIGRGAGVTGFGSAVPGTAGTALVSNGASADPSFQSISGLPVAVHAGDIPYWNGSAWVVLTGNNSGTQFLVENASGVPAWLSCAVSGTVMHGGAPPTCSAIVGADLPNPSTTTLGGVFSKAAVANTFVTGIDNNGNVLTGVVTLANPFTVGGVQYGGNITSGANYNILYGPDGRMALQIGGAGDLTNYSKSTNGLVVTNNDGSVVFGSIISSGLRLNGSGSGTLTFAVPAAAGANTLTFPAGTTNFSATGGASQVVKQTTSGGAFTVAQLAASDLSNGTVGTGAVVLGSAPYNPAGATTSTASTGGTVTMTNASTGIQVLTGSLTETYTLPDARTLSFAAFQFNNNSAGNMTIKDAGGTTLYTLLYGGMVDVFVLDTSTLAGSWDFHALVPNTASWGAFGLTLNDQYLKMLGPISATAWTTNGVRLTQDASTLTDTTSSGVVATAYTNVFGGSAIAATNPTTFTNYYGAYFKEPTASTNVTLTNKKALGADSLQITGGSALDGGLTVQTGFLATGLVGNASLANMANSTVKCRTTAGAGVPEDCTAAQVRTITEQGTTLLAVLTASSSANLADTTHFTSSFDDYMITFNNIVPATNSVGFNCLYHSGGVFPATNYVNNAGASTTFADMTSGGATVANTAGGGVTGTVFLRNVNSTSVNKFIDGRTYALLSGGGLSANNIVAIWNGAQTAVDGIQCQFTSGNISTGNIKIYGMRAAL